MPVEVTVAVSVAVAVEVTVFVSVWVFVAVAVAVLVIVVLGQDDAAQPVPASICRIDCPLFPSSFIGAVVHACPFWTVASKVNEQGVPGKGPGEHATLPGPHPPIQTCDGGQSDPLQVTNWIV